MSSKILLFFGAGIKYRIAEKKGRNHHAGRKKGYPGGKRGKKACG